MPAGTVVNSGSLVSPGGQQGLPGPNIGAAMVLGATAADPNAANGIVVPRYAGHPDAIWSYNAFDDHFDVPASGAPNAKWVVGGPTSGMTNPTLTQGGSELLLAGQSGTADATTYQYSVQQALPNHNPFTISCKMEADLQVYPNAASPNNVFALAGVKLMDSSGNYGAFVQLIATYQQSGQPYYYYHACQITGGTNFGTVFSYGVGGRPLYFRFVYLASGVCNIYGSRTGRTWYLIYAMPAASSGFNTNPPAYLAFIIQARWTSIAALQTDWVRFTNP